MRICLWSLCAVLFSSCTQLPPPVLSGALSDGAEREEVVEDRVPVIKPASGTRFRMEEERDGALRLVMAGPDARTLQRLLAIRAKKEGQKTVKRGRHFSCSEVSGIGSCEFRLLPPFGRVQEVSSPEQVENDFPEDAQLAQETAYLGVSAPEWGRSARLKVALAYAERIFDSLTGASVFLLPAGGGFEDGFRRMGEQINCLKTRKTEAPRPETMCYLRLDLSNGEVDKVEPDQHD